MVKTKKPSKKSHKKGTVFDIYQSLIEDTPREDLPKTNIHFKSIEDCRRALSVVTNQIRRNQINHAKAKLLIYAYLSLSQILDKTSVEKQIADLKTKLDEAEQVRGRK